MIDDADLSERITRATERRADDAGRSADAAAERASAEAFLEEFERSVVTVIERLAAAARTAGVPPSQAARPAVPERRTRFRQRLVAPARAALLEQYWIPIPIPPPKDRFVTWNLSPVAAIVEDGRFAGWERQEMVQGPRDDLVSRPERIPLARLGPSRVELKPGEPGYTTLDRHRVLTPREGAELARERVLEALAEYASAHGIQDALAERADR